MTELSFSKVHAGGTDFIVFADEAGERELTDAEVRALCDRGAGVGACGVIRAVRSQSLPEGREVLAIEPAAAWFMDLRAAGGSATELELASEAARALSHFLVESGLVTREESSMLSLATRTGVRDVLAGEDGYTVDLGLWRRGPEHLVEASGLAVARPGLGIQIAGPHIVTVLADDAELDELSLAVEPSVQPAIEGGASSEFVVAAEQLIAGGAGHIRVRSFARGIGEAPSYGAGAAAAALAFRHWGGERMPDRWVVEVAGGSLEVRVIPAPEGEYVALTGPASIAYSGTVEI